MDDWQFTPSVLSSDGEANLLGSRALCPIWLLTKHIRPFDRLRDRWWVRAAF
jgi:hypothetical protein